jgi:hypothetical protein
MVHVLDSTHTGMLTLDMCLQILGSVLDRHDDVFADETSAAPLTLQRDDLLNSRTAHTTIRACFGLRAHRCLSALVSTRY